MTVKTELTIVQKDFFLFHIVINQCGCLTLSLKTTMTPFQRPMVIQHDIYSYENCDKHPAHMVE